ncbi:uracil-DNA glycosylase [Pseudoduganella chitinolytica]|uniref:Uracil-DNA glycosylase n=1 Tax=Pseudoduganella chitinolytica TaxID=34070 RepID=A0ABY8BH17_9BURK|nr:uracil-DNA glycosylase [Pseudoduganella chitinolytica]WEF35236.1 uracil-DNA glycosylase [Pseudoduganella chitinolytica]
MSELSSRSAVFLDAMGVGPQWLLRDRPASAPEMMEAAAPEAVHADAVEPAPAVEAPPASAVMPTAAPAADTAWFDNAPPAPSTAPALKQPAKKIEPARPQAPSAAAEDTAWFDAVPTQAARPAAPAAPTGARAATDEEIASMDWHELQSAVRRCTRCDLCETRRAAVPGRGDEAARWLVLGLAPTAGDEESGMALGDEPGQLLENMLRAVDLSSEAGAYVTTLVKCRAVDAAGADRTPTAAELAACRPYLQRELELTEAGLALTLGGVTAKALLGAAARGKVLRHGELPVVATFHPADLLRRPEDKARAWADLCLARSAHAGRR